MYSNTACNVDIQYKFTCFISVCEKYIEFISKEIEMIQDEVMEFFIQILNRSNLDKLVFLLRIFSPGKDICHLFLIMRLTEF